MGRYLATALGRTRPAALLLVLLCSAALAKDLKVKDLRWEDAKVIDITSERGSAVVVPIAALVGGPVSKIYYWIQTDDTIYVLGPVLTRGQLLNVTLHGPTKLAIDGHNAHILDDYGKDEKMRVVERIARAKPDGRP